MTVIYSVTAIYIPVPSYTGLTVLTVEALVKGTVIMVVIKINVVCAYGWK